MKEITDEELWSLDCTIAKFVHPRLVEFKERFKGRSCPAKDDGTHMTSVEWITILDEMIFAMNYVINQFDVKDTEIRQQKETWKRVRRGLDLFSKYFFDLWD